MVKLTVTDAAKAAIDEYCRIGRDRFLDEGPDKGDLESLEVGDPVDHHHLVSISKCLVNSAYAETDEGSAHQWRLDTLLRGASVYQPPPPPKPEPVRIPDNCMILQVLTLTIRLLNLKRSCKG